MTNDTQVSKHTPTQTLRETDAYIAGVIKRMGLPPLTDSQRLRLHWALRDLLVNEFPGDWLRAAQENVR